MFGDRIFIFVFKIFPMKLCDCHNRQPPFRAFIFTKKVVTEFSSGGKVFYFFNAAILITEQSRLFSFTRDT